MYQLKFNGKIIYDPRGANETDKLIIRSPSVHLAVGAAGSVSFLIDDSHPLRHTLTRMYGVVELLEDGVPLFRGRIYDDSGNFYKARKILAEGALAYLNDSRIPPYDFPGDWLQDEAYKTAADSGNVVEFFLSWILAQHNAQVGPEQQIKLGTVTVADPNNYIARSNSKYESAHKNISDKLTSKLGGYLMIRYKDDGNYLDYLEDLPLTNVQEAEFGKNLLDLQDHVTGADFYTAILPLGKDGLTIASLPDEALAGGLVKSGLLIYNSEIEAERGIRIVKDVSWDDVTLPENLLAKAMDELGKKGVSMPETITCRVCDLHGVDDGSVPSFRVGRYVRMHSEPHGISKLYPLMELRPDILNPGNTKITMGVTTRTLTAAVASPPAAAAAAAAYDKAVSADKKVDSTAEVIMNQVTAIVQDRQAIILAAMEEYVEESNFESYKEQVAAQLKVLADEISITVSRETESIRAENADLQAKYEQITRIYRFTEEGFIIGTNDDSLTVQHKEDRISFLENGLEVAFISNRTLYITDAHFLNSIRLGNIAFIIRKNKNVSIVKVG